MPMPMYTSTILIRMCTYTTLVICTYIHINTHNHMYIYITIHNLFICV